MITELIVLADKLDKCGEKKTADLIDKLIKFAATEEDDDPWADEPTKVDMVARGPSNEMLGWPKSIEQKKEHARKTDAPQKKEHRKVVDPTAVALELHEALRDNEPDKWPHTKRRIVKELLMELYKAI
jgi:hypothetical protein